MLDAKLLNVNGNSLPGPLIIGTFEKRAPGLLDSNLNILNQLPIARVVKGGTESQFPA